MGDKGLWEQVGKTCGRGTMLFRDGDSGDAMYVVHEGRVRIFKHAASGEKTLAVFGAGEFFGEMALLNDKPRTASAEVVEDAKLLVIDRRTFGAMVASNREIAVRLITKLAQRLDRANALIEILMHKDPRARVILGLAREAEARGVEQEDASVVIPLGREELAEHVGLGMDDVVGVLKRLERLQIVEENEHGFCVPDVMRLHEFLEFLQTRSEPPAAV